MRRNRLALGLAAVAACSAAMLACSSSAPGTFRPTVAWGACPSDVESAFLSAPRCGYLTVLEDRARPGGRRIRLLLVKTRPVGERVLPGTATSIDADLGDSPRLDADTSTYAQRLRRTVVRMEPRGAGLHASPSLRCPEVDRLQTRAASAPTGDPAFTAAFVAAVTACAKRLEAQGIDLPAYDAQAQAGDLEDLRSALGLSGWAVMGSYGTNDAVLWDYLHTYPSRVDAAFSDSPSAPGRDPVLTAVQNTRRALHRLFLDCASRPVCAGEHPDLGGLWKQALARLTQSPLRGLGTASDGSPIPVLVDAGRLLRTARFALGGDGPGNLAALPRMIDEAAHGRLDPHLADLVAADPVLCAGYRPECPPPQDFALGSFLATFCRDQLPLVDSIRVQHATAEKPAYQELFDRDPYVAACRVWPTGDALPGPRSSVATTPLLLISGQLDSFSDPSLARTLSSREPHTWSLSVTGQTHNVLGFSECAITIRNEWTRHPVRTPRPPRGCPSATFD